MDTYKDQQEIEQMCQTGEMPWKNVGRPDLATSE